MSRRGFGREQGSALVFVLWIAVFISILAAGAAVAARSGVVEAGVEDQVMRETAALHSALEIAAWRVALQGRPALDQAPRTLAVGDYRVEVSRAPSSARIDVNMADEIAWMRVFAAAGAPQDVSRRLTDEILDWRDNDTAVRAFGAERGAYSGLAGKRIGNRAFASVDELVQVRSMTRERLNCIRPYLTAFGASGPIQGAPPGDFTPPERADGVRAAFAAVILSPDGSRGRRIEGLAQYGVSRTRPYEWVRFGGDDGAAPDCDPSAFQTGSPR